MHYLRGTGINLQRHILGVVCPSVDGKLKGACPVVQISARVRLLHVQSSMDIGEYENTTNHNDKRMLTHHTSAHQLTK